MKDIGSPDTDLGPNGDSYRLNGLNGEDWSCPRQPDAIGCRQMRVGPIDPSARRQLPNT
jgi:hypothetical protein